MSNLQPERRQLTVMFCDLVNSTNLSEQIDPEDLREVVLTYQRACESIIRNYDGYVAQFLGDGLLVYFGFPSARENDAQRGVKAGLQIIQRIQDLPLSNGMNHHKFQVRIGIHTGQVVVGDMGSEEKHERIAVGNVPNIAAKVQQAAGNNEILITSSTLELVQGHIDYDALGNYPVKGLSSPINLYKVLREKKLATRFDLVLSKGLTPFVGREKELNLLCDEWDMAKEEMGQVVLIKGEAGIGKSRLVHEFKNRISNETFFTHTYQCLPEYQNSAFYPLIQCYQDLLGFGSQDSDADKIKKLKLFVEKKRFSSEESIPLLASLLSINLDERYPALQFTPTKQREKTVEFLAALLSKDAEQTALLLIVEDFHWIDPSTLEFLNSLIGKDRNTKILVLITCRPGFKYEWVDNALITYLELGALDADDVEDIVNKIRDIRGSFKDVVKEVINRSDGVPLYVEELTKTILEANEVGKNQSSKYSSIPSSLSDLLMERLDRLGKAKEVAQIGSIIGGAFSCELLSYFETMEGTAIIDGIRKLLDAGLLVEMKDDEKEKYDFNHMLIKEAAYNSMLRIRRLMLHKKYGEILEEKFPKIIETNPEVLAYHYTAAGLPEKAIPYWINAGKNAQIRSALDEAISHVNNGFALIKNLSEAPQFIEQELILQILFGNIWIDKGSYTGTEVKKAFSRAVELSEKIENQELLFQALFGLFQYYSFVDYGICEQIITRLETIAESTKIPIFLLWYHASTGMIHSWKGELESSLSHFEKVISLYHNKQKTDKLLTIDPYIGSVCYKSTMLCWMGYPDLATETMLDPELNTVAASSPKNEVWLIFFKLLLCHAKGHINGTKEIAETLIEFSNKYGFLYYINIAKILQGWSDAEEGIFNSGIGKMKEGIDTFRALELKYITPYYIGLLAEAYLKIHDINNARDWLEEQIDFVYKENILFHESEFLRIKGKLMLATEKEIEAEECYNQSISAAKRMKAKLWEIRTVNDYCRLMMKQGRHTEAKQMLTEIYNWFTEGFDTKDLIEAKALLEELSRIN